MYCSNSKFKLPPVMCRALGSAKFSRWKNLRIKFRLMAHDYKCGKHSGFPLCCRLFYLARHECFEPHIGFLPNWFLKVKPIMMGEITWCAPSKLIPWYQKISDKYRGHGYIACPLCLWLGRFVKVKSCDCYINYTKNGDFYIGNKPKRD